MRMIVIFIDFPLFFTKIILMKASQLPLGSQQDVLIEPRKSLTDESLKDILKKCGLKITEQRLAILKALNSGPRYHKTAQDILDEVKKNQAFLRFLQLFIAFLKN